jgi:hypothetical protein
MHIRPGFASRIQGIDTEATLSPYPLPYEVINLPGTMAACGGMA